MTNIHFVTPTSGLKVKFTGTIDLKQLYKYMQNWLNDKGFANEKTIEKSYVERIKPEGKQIEILWECNKTASDYFKYKIKISFVLNGVSDVEVQRENYKIKLSKGYFQIFIVAFVEEGSKEWNALGPFSKLYHNLIARRRVEDHIGYLYNKVVSFQDYIKKFLELRT